MRFPKSVRGRCSSKFHQNKNMAHLTTFPRQDRLRVLAADSTSLTTQLLVKALARDAQFQMIESPSSAAAILDLTKREKPHVMVISAKLGEDHSGGLDLLRELRTQSPSSRVIVLLDSSEREAVIVAFRAGAQGVFCRKRLSGCWPSVFSASERDKYGRAEVNCSSCSRPCLNLRWPTSAAKGSRWHVKSMWFDVWPKVSPTAKSLSVSSLQNTL